MGIAVYPVRGSNADILFSRAEIARSSAFRDGKRSALFEEGQSHDHPDRLALEDDLHHAIDDNQRCLYFQPTYELAGSRVSSVEALLKSLLVSDWKIYRALVSGLTHDSNASAIVRTAIDLGRRLGFKVVAEVVETRETMIGLRALDAI